MTPDEALNKAMELLLSKEYEPIIIKALTNANDISAGAATLVYPIIFRMMQETDIPDEELLGNEQGDGIAIHLLSEVFDLAAKAGIIEDGEDDEPPEEARAMAEKAVQILGDLLAQATGAMNDAAQQGQPQNAPEQPPAPEQAQPQQPPAPQSRSLMGAVQ